MQNFYQKEAIQIAKRMIKAFFVAKNVDEVFNYINPKHFTWIGPGENEILTDIDEIRNHFKLIAALSLRLTKSSTKNILLVRIQVTVAL